MKAKKSEALRKTSSAEQPSFYLFSSPNFAINYSYKRHFGPRIQNDKGTMLINKELSFKHVGKFY
jgi:hypothetical protein